MLKTLLLDQVKIEKSLPVVLRALRQSWRIIFKKILLKPLKISFPFHNFALKCWGINLKTGKKMKSGEIGRKNFETDLTWAASKKFHDCGTTGQKSVSGAKQVPKFWVLREYNLSKNSLTIFLPICSPYKISYRVSKSCLNDFQAKIALSRWLTFRATTGMLPFSPKWGWWKPGWNESLREFFPFSLVWAGSWTCSPNGSALENSVIANYFELKTLLIDKGGL